MAGPQKLNRRLVPAALVALLAFGAVGTTLVAADEAGAPGSAPAAAPMPASIQIPLPKIGDAGSYNATIPGLSLIMGSEPASDSLGNPLPFLDFAWGDAKDIRGGDGKVHQVDQVQTTEYGMQVEFETDAEGSPSLVYEWLARGHAYLFERGTSNLVASVEDLSSTRTTNFTTSVAGVPIIVDGGETRQNFTSVDYEQSAGWACLFANALQGHTLSVGDQVVLAERACGASAGWLFDDAPIVLNATRMDRLDGRAAILLEGGWPVMVDLGEMNYAYANHVAMWVGDGIPVPLSMNFGGNGTTLEMELVAFQAGSTPRIPAGPAHDGLGPIETAPRAAWLVDDTGSTHPWPLSQAYQSVVADPRSGLGAFVKGHPGTYVAEAQDMSYTGNRGWFFTATDGAESYRVWVNRGTPFYGAAQVSGPASLVPVNQYTTEGLESSPAGPRFEDLTANLATLAGALERLSAYDDAADDAGGPTWGFYLFCAGQAYYWQPGCEADVELMAGYRSLTTTEPYLDTSTVPPTVRSDVAAESHYVELSNDRVVGLLHTATSAERTQGVGGPAPSGMPPAPETPKRAGIAAGIVTVPLPTPAEAASAGFLAVVIGALYFLWPKLKVLAFAGLFSRLRQPELLQHPHRAKIQQLVEAQPGIHFKELLRTSQIPNGTLVHHLPALERGGLVVPKSAGGYTCYYPKGARSDPKDALTKSDGAQQVLAAIRAQPGLSNLEVATLTGLQPSTVNYHVQKLTSAGLVGGLREGRSVRLRAVRA